jgi:hypothetical protein
MRSTVYDRFKKTGLLTDAERQGVPTVTPEMTGKTPKSFPSRRAEEFAPTSEDEPPATDPAQEEHHGTMENPVDLVDNKLIIRLDDGQLYELKMLSPSKNSSSSSAVTPSSIPLGGSY